MQEQANLFQTTAEPVFTMRYGSGHINVTYLVVAADASEYILQRINKTVFQNPEALMENIIAVTGYLGKKTGTRRERLTLVPAKDAKLWIQDSEGEYWRMYEFVRDTVCLDKIETLADFRESGAAFGNFQQQLADFPADRLHETIVDFHNTPNRYRLLKHAIQNDCCGRAADVQAEIEFALAREEYAQTLESLKNKGELPLRVTHNDTKLNNVLLDRETRKAVCVIDLDTVMPGLTLYDFGDAIRFGASTAAEDEINLDKVQFSLPLFQAYTEGFLSACGASLVESEINHLRDGAKMMTLECGVRFLTDYLQGDTYFHTTRARQNLDRCRTQFKLVAGMEAVWEEMHTVVNRVKDSIKIPI